MIDISKLLKNAPKGMTLYSPLFGEVKFKYINGSQFGIVVEDSAECNRSFDKYGRYFTIYNNAECLLFPSKECRTWENFKLTKPQFKAHDWVVSNGQPAIIYELKQNYYLGKYLNGHDFCHKYTDEDKLHLWTIQDAKDGDILISRSGNPFIYNGNIEFSSAGAYVGISQDGKIRLEMFPSKSWTSIKGIKPATKEQCDLLFQKMKEEGYKWNAEKKELRKIIKPTFKVGDEIFRAARNEYFKIKGIEKDNDTVWYVTTRTHIADNDKRVGEIVRINAFYQNEYSIAPKSHYDISNFHAGMPVLVRDDDGEWRYVLFSHIGNGCFSFNAAGTVWQQCIPFNDDTKHLLGTTNMCPEEYINW